MRFSRFVHISTLLSLTFVGCRSNARRPTHTLVSFMGSGETSSELEFMDRELAALPGQDRLQFKTMVGYDTIDERLGLYKDLFRKKSHDPDVCKIDTIWAGALSNDLIDLRPFLDEELTNIDADLLNSFTVNGRLIGLPIFVNTPALYYRTDLLQKYGFAEPPTNWDQMTRMAAVIQAGERAGGNQKFWGYLWQGVDAEALTCNALEWQMSEGGGNIIENDGSVSVANPNAARAIQRAASWVGTISPPGVVEYDEDDSEFVWLSGNAAFFRGWLDVFGRSSSTASGVRGKFAAAPLPGGMNGGRWTFGGMAFGVSKYSKCPKEAIAAVRYLASAAVQRRRADMIRQIPSRPELLRDEALLRRTAFNGRLGKQWRQGLVWRPSGVSGSDYESVSRVYTKAVHEVLTHRVSATQALESAQARLKEVLAHTAQRP